GVNPAEVDAVIGAQAQELVLGLRLGPCTRLPWQLGIPIVLEAADLVASGRADVVLIAAGGAPMYSDRSSTAPWTRPANEFVVGYGLFTAAERAADFPSRPVWILGGASDSYGPAYQIAPAWDLLGRSDIPAGYVGRAAARHAFTAAGLRPGDLDVAELYDPFSFEIIRQLEAYGFCADGEGGAFVEDGNIGPGGRLPVTTDGGTMSYSHAGINAQQLQRVIRAVEQL